MSSILHDGTSKKGAKQLLAYDFIKKAILDNQFRADELLNEVEIGKMLGGVSRTPIREALQSLVHEGLVRYVPGKGMFVSGIKYEDVLQILEARVPLERAAIELFMERASKQQVLALKDALREQEELFNKHDFIGAHEVDNKFHLIIANGSNNARLYNFIENLLLQSNQYVIARTLDRNKQALQDHIAIFEAIESKDINQAKLVMEQHIQGWASYVMSYEMNKLFHIS